MNVKNMPTEELEELLTDVIDEREGFPEDSMSERAQELDELYSDVTNELAARAC